MLDEAGRREMQRLLLDNLRGELTPTKIMRLRDLLEQENRFAQTMPFDELIRVGTFCIGVWSIFAPDTIEIAE